MKTMPANRGNSTFRFRHREELLRSVLDNAAVATFLISPDNRLLYANRAFYELLGYETDEPVDVGVGALVFPDDVPRTSTQFQELLDGQRDSYRAERRYRKKNGNPIWVLVKASAIRDEESGAAQYVIVQAIDIDRQKRAEAALAESESRWNFAWKVPGRGSGITI